RIQLSSGSLHTMVGGVPSSRALGLKTYTVYGAPRFLVVLFDSENGELLSIMEADRLGQLRTGAASGVATRYLARPDAAVVGLFGAVAAGALAWDRVHELGDVVVGNHPGRASAGQITLFESLGLGVEDLALAARVYRLAKARGLGREIEIFGSAGQHGQP